MKYSQIINSIEAEISSEEMRKLWVDSELALAWTSAVDRFYNALTHKPITSKLEGESFKLEMIKLVRKYREKNKISPTYSFLESLAVHAGMNVSTLGISKEVTRSSQYVYQTVLDLSPVTRWMTEVV